ncbi:MAG: gliding motility-associated C-terminal domain-containing protein [Dinghuibacter sp.]|nr:gliding motility-associated C-terminal domain-containing protein [Dinghuibacter sp.]
MGEVVWAKSIQTAVRGYPLEIKEQQNGDVLIMAKFTSGDSIKIIKINPSGNIVWSKLIYGFSNEAFYEFKIETNNDEIYLYGVSEPQTGPESGYFLNTIIKLDNGGNVLWSNYYGRSYSCEGSFPTALVLSGDSLIVIGRIFPGSCINPNIGLPNRERSFFAMKVHKTTGRMGQSVSYTNPRELAPNTGAFPNNLYNKAVKINNSIYLTGRFNFFVVPKYGVYQVTLNENLNILGGTLFYHTNTSLPVLSGGSTDDAGSLSLVYFPTIINNKQYVAKFNAMGAAVRQKKIVAPAGYTASFSGRTTFTNKRNYLSAVTNFKSNNHKIFQLFQLSNDEQNSICFGADTSFIRTEPFTLIPYSTSFFDNDFGFPVGVSNNYTTSGSFPLLKSDYCNQVSVCNSFALSGPDTICSKDTYYLFRATKNAACLKHVLFSIDTTALSGAEQLNDTTIALRFKASWTGYLYGTISSCSQLRDSVLITVRISPDTVNLGADTLLCSGQPLVLNAGSGFRNYTWSNGSHDSAITVTTPGLYSVTAYNYCNQQFRDTIVVSNPASPVVQLGNDTAICANKPLLLNAANGSIASYAWNTGETTPAILAGAAGTYSVVATTINGCLVKDTINILNVFPAPVVLLDKKSTVCVGQNNILDAGPGFNSYLWQDGTGSRTILVTRTGKYSVTVMNTFGCYASDSVLIAKLALPEKHFLYHDTAICKDEPIVLFSQKQFTSYLWSNSSARSQITVSQPGLYWLEAIDDNLCVSRDSVMVSGKDCTTYFFMPTAFTPNNDGMNDVFKPLLQGRIEQYELMVYNRYGQRIFYSNNGHAGWDGTFKGTEQGMGAYTWMCTFKAKGEPVISRKGTVLLIK